MKTVIFDLDGTLADTSGDLIDAANACMAEIGEGPQLVYGQDSATAVKGAKAMLRLCFQRLGWPEDEREVDKHYPRFLEIYGNQLDKHSFLYDGAIEAVETLKTMRYRVGICTNKPEAMARTLMTSLGVLNEFDVLIGADTLPVRKPDPRPLLEAISRAGGNPTSSVLIGDTVTDRDTAKAANVPSVLVTFGPAGRTVADLKPDAMIDHFDELPMVVQMLTG